MIWHLSSPYKKLEKYALISYIYYHWVVWVFPHF